VKNCKNSRPQRTGERSDRPEMCDKRSGDLRPTRGEAKGRLACRPSFQRAWQGAAGRAACGYDLVRRGKIRVAIRRQSLPRESTFAVRSTDARSDSADFADRKGGEGPMRERRWAKSFLCGPPGHGEPVEEIGVDRRRLGVDCSLSTGDRIRVVAPPLRRRASECASPFAVAIPRPLRVHRVFRSSVRRWG
jgi:hypothetical protein